MSKGMQLVAFKVGRELYGVEIQAVKEIVRFQDVTEVPEAPPFLEGVMNLRGQVVPVIDLRKRLRMPAAERTKATRVLIVEDPGTAVGLIVDKVTEVLRIQPDAVQEPPEMVSAIGVEYISGVVNLDQGLLIVMNINMVLSTDDMNKWAGSAEQAAHMGADPA